jgi:hypothetical protein
MIWDGPVFIAATRCPFPITSPWCNCRRTVQSWRPTGRSHRNSVELSQEPPLENRAYDNYDALEEAAMTAWKQSVLDTELMKTVCNAPYLKTR